MTLSETPTRSGLPPNYELPEFASSFSARLALAVASKMCVGNFGSPRLQRL